MGRKIERPKSPEEEEKDGCVFSYQRNLDVHERERIASVKIKETEDFKGRK